MLLCHFKFSFEKDKLNFRFIGTLKNESQSRAFQDEAVILWCPGNSGSTRLQKFPVKSGSYIKFGFTLVNENIF